MWALRRSSNPLKFRGFSRGILCASGVNSDSVVGCSKHTISEHPQLPLQRSLFFHTGDFSSKLFGGGRGLSSQAGTKSGESESELDEGFSELEVDPNASVTEGGDSADAREDALASDDEMLSDDESDAATELADAEHDIGESKSAKKQLYSEIFHAIVTAPNVPVKTVLDKWVAEGKSLSQAQIPTVMLSLRKRRFYWKALEFSEWLEDNKQIDFVEKDYACRLDLIAKLRGIERAEKFMEKVPKAYRGELLYRTLLANCVVANNPKKAEEVFNKMKDLEFPVSAFSCNQLLLLYKRTDKKKIADILLLMENENVKPTMFTYGILMDIKGQMKDLDGMDKIFSTMKAEGVEPDVRTQCLMAKHYANGGLKEKARSILKDIEGNDLNQNRWVCQLLLPLYASLGDADEVERIWKFCETKTRVGDYLAAVEAWGKLKKIDQAEAAFENMKKQLKKLSSKHYAVLLKVYADHKMLNKGKNLINQMGDSGCRIGPLTWDALIKLYVEAGELDKADSTLNKVSKENNVKPMFTSYMAIMEKYAKKGDVHNAEKLFYKMRQAGYVARLRQFQCLMQAYAIAKTPAYGMRERLKADNIFPNKGLAAQLAQVDAFRRTVVSDLLD